MFQQFSQTKKGLLRWILVPLLFFSIIFLVFQVMASPLPETVPFPTKEAPASTSTPFPILAVPVPTVKETTYSSVAPEKPDEVYIQQAMNAVLAKQLGHWGVDYQAEIGSIQTSDNWAYSAASWQSPTRKFEEHIHILAHQLPNGSWQALLPDTEGLYFQWIEQVPDDLLVGTNKAALYEQAILNSK